MLFDHVKIPYTDIYKFDERVEKISITDLQNKINNLYNWEKQTVVILGNKKLIKVLRKSGYKVLVKDYKDYL